MTTFTRTSQLLNEQKRSEDRPLLSVVVPVFNEQATLAELLKQLLEETTDKEIILVDDGSVDNSARVVGEWWNSVRNLNAQTHRITWLSHARNLGKGAAVRSGLSVARGKYFLAQDADLEVSPAEYGNLLQPLVSNQAEFVIGTRARSPHSRMSLQWCGISVLNWLVRILYGYRVSDASCCFKVLETCDLLRMKLQCHRFEYCPEVVAKAARLKLAIAEVAVAYSPRSVGEGKKLRLLRDGLQAATTLLRFCRWSPPQLDQETDCLVDSRCHGHGAQQATSARHDNDD